MKKRVYRPLESTEFSTPENCSILEIINTDDFRPFSLARARVKPGAVTQLHALLGVDEAYYILSGEGIMEIDGEQTEKLQAGDAVLILKGVSQKIMNTGEQDLLFICVCAPRFREGVYQNNEQE